jgi:hypothetical protein
MFKYWQELVADWLAAMELWAWLCIRQATVSGRQPEPEPEPEPEDEEESLDELPPATLEFKPLTPDCFLEDPESESGEPEPLVQDQELVERLE